MPKDHHSNLLDKSEYKMILGSDIREGDKIVHDAGVILVNKVSLGSHAGSVIFGNYISILGHWYNYPEDPSPVHFWSYRDKPEVRLLLSYYQRSILG
jgi:hypothetical protein